MNIPLMRTEIKEMSMESRNRWISADLSESRKQKSQIPQKILIKVVSRLVREVDSDNSMI